MFSLPLAGDRTRVVFQLVATEGGSLTARFDATNLRTYELDGYMAASDTTRTVTISRKQDIYFSWTSDVLIYVVVLNLFVEYLPAVIIESFTISILTAVLLKILLDFVMGIEHHVHSFFEQKEGAIYRVLGTVSLFTILFLGKLFILEAVNFVFGDHVELGHFIEVVALVLALMITRELFHRFYLRLGAPAETE